MANLYDVEVLADDGRSGDTMSDVLADSAEEALEVAKAGIRSWPGGGQGWVPVNAVLKKRGA